MRFLGPHSAGEGPHLVPISLKFGSPSGPHFEKSGSPGLVGTVPVVDESQKSQFEKRKRNLKAISPISRGEREIWIHFPQFREEKEKFENHFSNFERRKRKLSSLSLVSRREREIRQNILNFREEKVKFWLHFYNFEKRRRILKFFILFRE